MYPGRGHVLRANNHFINGMLSSAFAGVASLSAAGIGFGAAKGVAMFAAVAPYAIPLLALSAGIGTYVAYREFGKMKEQNALAAAAKARGPDYG